MIVSSHISADLQTPGYPPLVHAVQGEQYSRQIKMTLYSGGVAWTVPGGVFIAMRYEKPDGTHGYYDTLPDGTKAWSAEGNTVSIYVAPQMLTTPGVVQGQLEIVQNTSILASFPLRLKVAANLAATLQKSEDYVNWVEWMEEQITQIWEDAVASGELTGPQGPPPTKLGDVTDYQSSPSGDTIPTGEWTETIPAVPQGQYLWTRVTTTWDSGRPVVSYTSARQGVDGASVILSTSEIVYQAGASGETAPTGEWSATVPAVSKGQYLWTRMTRTYNTGYIETLYSVGYIGLDGTSVTRISSVTDYQVGESGERVPTGEWSEAIPAVPQGKFLWTRRTQTYSSGPLAVDYSVVRQPVDGTGSVSSVFGISPGPDGDVPTTGALEALGGLSTSGGTMTGPINMTGQPLTGLNPPTGETEAATKGYVDGSVRKAAPRNLLDNSDFRNPVNQRGKTTYTDLYYQYCIDRWVTAGTTFNVATRTITGTGELVENIKLYQILPDGATVIGNKYTLAAKINNNIYTLSFINDSSKQLSTDFGYLLFWYDSSIVEIRLNPGVSIVVDWVALYPGAYTADTIPEYQPKGYAAELAECQRYCYILKNFAVSGYFTASAKDFQSDSINAVSNMRATPTLAINGTIVVRTVSGYSTASGFDTSIGGDASLLSGVRVGSNGIRISFPDAATSVNNSCGSINISGTAVFSADL